MDLSYRHRDIWGHIRLGIAEVASFLGLCTMSLFGFIGDNTI